jgi:hypothetical protein
MHVMLLLWVLQDRALEWAHCGGQARVTVGEEVLEPRRLQQLEPTRWSRIAAILPRRRIRGALAQRRFQRSAALIGTQLGEPTEAVRKEADALAEEVVASGGGALEAAAARKTRLFREVVAAWAARHPVQRDTVESATRASYRTEDWESLNDETRRMLVSAEAYAIHQPEGMDYSGPLLVLCAACERELNLRFFGPLGAELPAPPPGQPALIPGHPTLGHALFLLRHGLDLATAEKKGQSDRANEILGGAKTPSEGAAWQTVATKLVAEGYDLSALATLLERLSRLNKRYRRPAAHDTAVERETWVLGRGLVLGPDETIHEIVRALPSQPTEHS